MNDSIKAFGVAVCVERAKCDLTQRELAEQLDTSVRTVSKIENGQNSPRFETVAQFSNSLNISLDAIVLEAIGPEVPRCVMEFFAGMSSEQAERYIHFIVRPFAPNNILLSRRIKDTQDQMPQNGHLLFPNVLIWRENRFRLYKNANPTSNHRRNLRF